MKTAEEIYQEMLALFRSETGTEAAGVSDLSVRLYAVAAQVFGLYAQSEWLSRQCFPQTAVGEYLSRHAALRGLSRRAPVRAEGVLRFLVDTPPAADLIIPRGTVCATAGMVRFETVEPGKLIAGQRQADVKARAVEPGVSGNVPAGSILAMTVPPVGVSRCLNPEPFSGGTGEETDEELRKRILETYRRMPNGANAAFYEQMARSFPQVAEVNVIPRSRGRGTVDVVIATETGLPEEQLVNEVGTYIQDRREISVDVKVRAPSVKTVPVTLKVTAEASARKEEVRRETEEAIRTFFGGKRLGKGVLRAELMQLVFSRQNVGNCSVTEPAADVKAVAGELPQLGTLHVEVI